MNEEVRLTLDAHECHAWSNIRKNTLGEIILAKQHNDMIPENIPRLTVSFDMDWQQHSSVNKYNSNSKHAFCIRGYSKNTLDNSVKFQGM